MRTGVIVVLTALLCISAVSGRTFYLQLVKDPYEVGAGAYWDIPFSLNLDQVSNVFVQGWYNASGDILCFLFDKANWELAQKGQNTQTIYYSGGTVTHDEFLAPVMTNRVYYLVFSNTFSTTESKTVWGDVRLTWEMHQPALVFCVFFLVCLLLRRGGPRS